MVSVPVTEFEHWSVTRNVSDSVLPAPARLAAVVTLTVNKHKYIRSFQRFYGNLIDVCMYTQTCY